MSHGSRPTVLLFCILLGLISVPVTPAAAQSRSPLNLEQARRRMVEEEIVGAGVKDERVIKAMLNTPRHEFVGLNQRQQAYYDMALPIGDQQTISAPFIVAYMTEQLEPKPSDKVLEIGTGSGYQAAVLGPLVKEVYTIEIVKPLGEKAARTLKRLKYGNVFVKVGDGYQGWPEHAPFDKIIVTCSPEKVPPALVAQLREGGRMIIPVGERYQQVLYLLEKRDGKLVSQSLLPTLFVPMTGTAEAGRRVLPDPLKPEIISGGFEDFDDETLVPHSWHHPRQVKVVEDVSSPEGEHYLAFENADAGRGSHVLQGFAIDGRKVRRLELSMWVKGENLRPGQSREQLPMAVITFYDQSRGQAGPRAIVGPWRLSFDWHEEKLVIEVPRDAREAILQVGMFGGTGELSVDGIELTAP